MALKSEPKQKASPMLVVHIVSSLPYSIAIRHREKFDL